MQVGRQREAEQRQRIIDDLHEQERRQFYGAQGPPRRSAHGLPTHTPSNPCTGKVFTVEMHHTRVDFASPGDNVGLNIKGLDKQNMPRSGDVMVYKKDTTLGQTREFTAQIQVLDIPNEIKVGYSPIGFVRCGRAACRLSKLTWKMGKETGWGKLLSTAQLCYFLDC